MVQGSLMTLWSDTARSEFQALFHDADYSRQFKRDVARALMAGWSNNKDKPIWAWLRLQWALCAGPDAPLASDGPMAILRDGRDLWHALRQMAQDGSQACLPDKDGSLMLDVGAQRLRLTRYKVQQIAKIAQFILGCDNYQHTPDILDLLSKVNSLDRGDTASFNGLVRDLSKLWYRYRANHFKEGAAAETLKLVDSCLPDDFSAHQGFDPVLELWQHPSNTRLTTYKSCFWACVQSLETKRQARLLDGLTGAEARDDHIVEAASAAMADLQSTMGYAQSSQILETNSEESQLERFQARLLHAEIKLFNKADLDTIESLLACSDCLPVLWASWLKMTCFHPIQAGISNDLRFAAKTLANPASRMDGRDAVSYAALVGALDKLSDKLRKWLTVAYGLRRAEDSSADPMSQEGLRILAKERLKSLERPRAELATEFEAMEPALLMARESLETYTRLLRPHLRRLDDDFDQDLAIFLDTLRQHYAELLADA